MNEEGLLSIREDLESSWVRSQGSRYHTALHTLLGLAYIPEKGLTGVGNGLSVSYNDEADCALPTLEASWLPIGDEGAVNRCFVS